MLCMLSAAITLHNEVSTVPGKAWVSGRTGICCCTSFVCGSPCMPQSSGMAQSMACAIACP
jgi:hypothetical protein